MTRNWVVFFFPPSHVEFFADRRSPVRLLPVIFSAEQRWSAKLTCSGNEGLRRREDVLANTGSGRGARPPVPARAVQGESLLNFRANRHHETEAHAKARLVQAKSDACVLEERTGLQGCGVHPEDRSGMERRWADEDAAGSAFRRTRCGCQSC